MRVEPALRPRPGSPGLSGVARWAGAGGERSLRELTERPPSRPPSLPRPRSPLLQPHTPARPWARPPRVRGLHSQVPALRPLPLGLGEGRGERGGEGEQEGGGVEGRLGGGTRVAGGRGRRREEGLE